MIQPNKLNPDTRVTVGLLPDEIKAEAYNKDGKMIRLPVKGKFKAHRPEYGSWSAEIELENGSTWFVDPKRLQAEGQ